MERDEVIRTLRAKLEFEPRVNLHRHPIANPRGRMRNWFWVMQMGRLFGQWVATLIGPQARSCRYYTRRHRSSAR